MKKKKRRDKEEDFQFDFHLDLDSVTDDSSDEEEKPRKKRAKPLNLDIPNQKKTKKKKKALSEIPMSGPGKQIEDFSLDLEMPSTDTEMTTQDTGPEPAQMKQMTVTLEYDKSILADHWFLIMESVEDFIEHEIQGPAKEKDIDYWFDKMNHLGAMPMRVLFKDGVRFCIALYAAAFIHHNKLAYGAEAEQRNAGPSVANPDFDPFKENVAQEGRHWGIRMEKEDLPRTGISPEERQKARQSVDPLGSNFVDDGSLPNPFKSSTELLEATKLPPKDKPPEGTVAAQVEQKQAEDLEKFKATQSTESDYVDERAKAKAVYETKFAEAQRLAHLPREAWQNAPYELVKMIEYIQRWYKETGSIPPVVIENLIELYWEAPNVILTPEATGRRDKLIQTLRGFWQSSVAGATPESGFNVFSQSYRTTLAAMELEKLIERYASGEEITNDVRNAAIRYFHAHFPVDRLGAKPGPVSTNDPTYPEYLKLCQKYNLVPGTLLHEANL